METSKISEKFLENHFTIMGECGYNVGQHVAFNDIGGVYIEMDDREYVVITPDMVIGILGD